MATADFPMITGPEVEGTVMAAAADARKIPAAAEVVARFQAAGLRAARDSPCTPMPRFRSGPQAAEAAGSLDLAAVIAVLHSRQFDTVLGQIGFDEKGDVTGFRPVAMVRLAGGRHLYAAGAERGQG